MFFITLWKHFHDKQRFFANLKNFISWLQVQLSVNLAASICIKRFNQNFFIYCYIWTYRDKVVAGINFAHCYEFIRFLDFLFVLNNDIFNNQVK